MSENNPSAAAPPPDSSQNAASGKRPQKDPKRRLLLYEILIEEYETHRPPDETAEQEAEEEASGKVRQPKLDPSEIEKIRDAGDAYRRQWERIDDDNERAVFEEKYNGELVSRFFVLLAKGQKKDAEAKFEQLTKKYAQMIDGIILNLFREGKLKEQDRQELTAERMAIADIYGLMDEYEERERSKDRKAGENNPAEMRSDEEIRVAVLTALLDDLRKERLKSEGNGGGNGTAKGGDNGGGASIRYNSADEARHACERTERAALCLSGGGIRSATFNLGILQGLARHGLLEQFDYLSTVSGGGFIGSWLTAWMHRRGMDEVIKGLSKQPPSPLQPEPSPINHLRVFSNYLSPQPGLLSADTWTLIATVLRNLVLTWLVFVPILLAALLAPRLWMAMVMRPTFGIKTSLEWSFGLALIAGWLGLGCAGFFLSTPKSSAPPRNLNPYKSREMPFLLLCLLPCVISTASLAIYWRRLGARFGYNFNGYRWRDFVIYAFLLIALPWLFTAVYRFVTNTWRHWRDGKGELGAHVRRHVRRLVVATLALALAQAVTGGLLYAVFTKLFPLLLAADPRLYAALSVPLLLVVLALDCTLIAGFTSEFTHDDDMEWWARAGAWLLIAIVVWAMSHLLVLFGPSLILLIGERWRKVGEKGSVWNSEFLKAAGQAVTILIGIVSGVVTLAGGFSAKTPASSEEVKPAGASKLAGALPSLLAPFFLAFLVILLAVLTNLLLTSTSGASRWVFGDIFSASFHGASSWDHRTLVGVTPVRHLLLFGTGTLILGGVMGLLINTNKFSLHYMWHNRITRAYLGASREKRNPQSFTGFDNDDNLRMFELRDQPEEVSREVVERMKALREEKAAMARSEETEKPPRKLFHVLNIALNLAGGDKLAWQDRKSESFTVSPLHAGSYWLGYRRSFVYGGEQGISLGTSVAISGAFVSPNMGYMMTSPVVRFLMMLFNVRFGWWLGNPGPAGDKANLAERFVERICRRFGFDEGLAKPFERKAPLLSVRPIVEEAFGKTNDKHPYVYLSDGGHFENLGLYEMVLRRCRYIVVCDASTDADYNFESLAQSIRQIRVDLGVPIDITDMSIMPPAQDLRGKYCATGRIRYSCVERKAGDPSQAGMTDKNFDGTLIYIKAAMIGGEPRDVVNYGLGSKSFPQEIIVDQWFSEAQFESYRALGSHIIDIICGGDRNEVKMAAFERKVKEHNQVDFRVFRERISYAALANQFRKTMRRATPARYEDKVKEYLRDILD
jgi:hypothetical protein